jgi:predicted RNA-binding protein with TRAM domain
MDSASNYKPVNIGETYGVQIIGQGSKLDGVAKYKGLVIFVPNAKPGEHVNVRIKTLFKRSALAEVVSE